VISSGHFCHQEGQNRRGRARNSEGGRWGEGMKKVYPAKKETVNPRSGPNLWEGPRSVRYMSIKKTRGMLQVVSREGTRSRARPALSTRNGGGLVRRRQGRRKSGGNIWRRKKKNLLPWLCRRNLRHRRGMSSHPPASR